MIAPQGRKHDNNRSPARSRHGYALRAMAHAVRLKPARKGAEMLPLHTDRGASYRSDVPTLTHVGIGTVRLSGCLPETPNRQTQTRIAVTRFALQESRVSPCRFGEDRERHRVQPYAATAKRAGKPLTSRHTPLGLSKTLSWQRFRAINSSDSGSYRFAMPGRFRFNSIGLATDWQVLGGVRTSTLRLACLWQADRVCLGISTPAAAGHHLVRCEVHPEEGGKLLSAASPQAKMRAKKQEGER